MMKTRKAKKPSKKAPLLNTEQKQSPEPYGTQWPNTIGSKRRPDDDGKIRDSRGIVI